ncbi:MAG TPA: hypothetical protein VLU91_01490 [Nitrososphaerales archaeon]|nr:hypothetical protein [Nitrososphaerales archaeon]
MVSFSFPTDPLSLAVYLVGLVILWVIVSIPVYFAGKAIKGGNAGFGQAMGATLGGVIVYWIVFLVVAYFVGSVIGPPADALALIIGLVAWLGIFRAAFHTSWLGAIGIVFVAWLILLVLDFLLVAIFNAPFPKFYPF